jgi:hypothetical protein
LWSAIVVFAFVAYLLIPFNIIVDLFWHDHAGLDEGAVCEFDSFKAKALS